MALSVSSLMRKKTTKISRTIQISICYAILATPCSTAFNGFGDTKNAGLVPISPGEKIFRHNIIHRRIDRISRKRHFSQPLRFRFSIDSPLFSSESSYEYINRGVTKIDHRNSASDWLHNVFTLPRSSILREIKNPVIVVTLWSTVVSIAFRFFKSSSSQIIQKIACDMCIGTAFHSILASSLGLLLVFRTNSAYQRFAEGRKIWEDIHSVSRNFNRMMNIYESEITPKRKQRVQNLLAAFPYLLRHHIRPRCLKCTGDGGKDSLLLYEPPLPAIQTRHEGDKMNNGFDKPRECWVDKRTLPWCLLPSDTLSQFRNAPNRPLWVCDRMAKEITSVPYNQNFTSRERLALLGHIDKLSKTIGECERIHQTAVPLNYARHSLRGLSLWLFTLPFAFVDNLGLLTGPVVGVMAWLMFGVYQIGYSIEDPFQRTLRLSILCDAIKRDVLEDGINSAYMLEERDAQVEHADMDFSIFNGVGVDELLVKVPHIVNYDGDRSYIGLAP